MFKFARFIVQHKIGMAALIVLGVVLFAPAKEEHSARSNAWSASSSSHKQTAVDPGMFDQIVAKADTMLAESGYDPRETAEATVGRFDNVNKSYEQANAD